DGAQFVVDFKPGAVGRDDGDADQLYVEVAAQAALALCQGVIALLGLDGETGEVRIRSHLVDLEGARRAGDAPVNGEGADDLVCGGEDRLRPTGPQAGWPHKLAGGDPVGMSEQILCNHAFPQIGGRAATTDLRSDGQ